MRDFCEGLQSTTPARLHASSGQRLLRTGLPQTLPWLFPLLRFSGGRKEQLSGRCMYGYKGSRICATHYVGNAAFLDDQEGRPGAGSVLIDIYFGEHRVGVLGCTTWHDLLGVLV